MTNPINFMTFSQELFNDPLMFNGPLEIRVDTHPYSSLQLTANSALRKFVPRSWNTVCVSFR